MELERLRMLHDPNARSWYRPSHSLTPRKSSVISYAAFESSAPVATSARYASCIKSGITSSDPSFEIAWPVCRLAVAMKCPAETSLMENVQGIISGERLALATSGLGLSAITPRNLDSPRGCQARLVRFGFHSDWGRCSLLCAKASSNSSQSSSNAGSSKDSISCRKSSSPFGQLASLPSKTAFS